MTPWFPASVIRLSCCLLPTWRGFCLRLCSRVLPAGAQDVGQSHRRRGLWRPGRCLSGGAAPQMPTAGKCHSDQSHSPELHAMWGTSSGRKESHESLKPRLTARRPCAAVSKALFQRAGFPLAPLAVAMGSTQETWALPSAASSLPQAECLLGEFAGEGTKQAVWVLGRTSTSTVPGLLESGLCTSGPSDTGQESTVQGREEDTSDGGLCADESDLCLGFAALSAMHSRLQV